MRCVVRSGAFSAFTKPVLTVLIKLSLLLVLLHLSFASALWLASHTCWEATIA